MTTKAPSKTAPSGQGIEVDFLYLDLATCSRCRDSDASLSAAIEAVRPALDSIGASLEVRKTLVVNEEQARQLRFVGSPTILVNGRDIADELLESPCSECGELCGCEEGVDCRAWNYRGEQHTEAPTGLIVEAILAELARPGVARTATLPSVDVPENLKRFFSGTTTNEGQSTCCSADEQATCCEQAEKVSCCDGSASSPCGCR